MKAGQWKRLIGKKKNINLKYGVGSSMDTLDHQEDGQVGPRAK